MRGSNLSIDVPAAVGMGKVTATHGYVRVPGGHNFVEDLLDSVIVRDLCWIRSRSDEVEVVLERVSMS